MLYKGRNEKTVGRLAGVGVLELYGSVGDMGRLLPCVRLSFFAGRHWE